MSKYRFDIKRQIKSYKELKDAAERLVTLSQQELLCYSMMSYGDNTVSIAKMLGKSDRTIETVKLNVKKKLRAKTTHEALAILFRNKILN